ncbi:hypothetical protein RhiirC2_797608 [Rhizophagus irregularis]|uniref:F-box domain-containing protein n=1 Tax=Rhizophagus irregularis TaxID=588596 RepID=A0A2N1M7R4_9GLOM|nr:hypothetical protein RhiirC2_797608 [Rhizophagus irregularis]
MAYKLPADCLNEIFENLEQNKPALHSCLLVNRLWCRTSVRILWRNVLNFNSSDISRQSKVESSILHMLIACLPNKSKKLLSENRIVSFSTFTPPLFNYAAYCKVLPICRIIKIVENVYINQFGKLLVLDKIFQMFTSQISSLKKLIYPYNKKYQDKYKITFSLAEFPGARELSELCCGSDISPNFFRFPLTEFPGARKLSELRCGSNIPSEFFQQLSQISHNVRPIFIDFNGLNGLNGLEELISKQKNLKNLAMSTFDVSWENVVPALKSQSNTITKLHLYSNNICLPLSFVSFFINLQEVIFSFPPDDGVDDDFIENFVKIEASHFPRLQVLKIPFQRPKPESLIKFLKNNGKTLKKLFICELESAAISSIANFCLNLQSLFVIFKSNELHLLQAIFIRCQYLESIKIWCGVEYLNETEVLEIVANHSPNSFHELKIYNADSDSNFASPGDIEFVSPEELEYASPGHFEIVSPEDLESEDLEFVSPEDLESSKYLKFVSPKDLESFFISWENRVPKKLLSLIILKKDENKLLDEESMKIAKKYENLGVIKFGTKLYDDDEVEEVFEYF